MSVYHTPGNRFTQRHSDLWSVLVLVYNLIELRIIKYSHITCTLNNNHNNHNKLFYYPSTTVLLLSSITGNYGRGYWQDRLSSLNTEGRRRFLQHYGTRPVWYPDRWIQDKLHIIILVVIPFLKKGSSSIGSLAYIYTYIFILFIYCYIAVQNSSHFLRATLTPYTQQGRSWVKCVLPCRTMSLI